jgi:hypothetical protein
VAAVQFGGAIHELAPTDLVAVPIHALLAMPD